MHVFFKAFPVLTWLLLLSYWIWNSRNTKIVSQRENGFKRFFMYVLPILVAVLLLGPGEVQRKLLELIYVLHKNKTTYNTLN